MSKNQPLYRDCTKYCRSVIHGDLITAAITKRSISDMELCSYLNYICTNCESVKDSCGRTALHVAASCGRIELMRWLLKIRNANCNIKDEESGYTPLHRALFYGKINAAVELLKNGANSFTYDMDSLTAIEHVTKDGQIPEVQYGSLYTWGLNNNNSLGSFSSRITPESLGVFHKRYPAARVLQVCIDKFHCIIVTSLGEAYSIGHGLGGRLGLGTEQTVVVPTKIEFRSAEKVSISKASIGRDHCLFLTSDSIMYSCGSNKHKVLGLSPAHEKVLNPQKIKHLFGKEIVGINAARYHSAAWTSTCLYTWGHNLGQLGHEPVNGNYYINIPKQVKSIKAEDSSIVKVASSDGAIAISTSKGAIYVLHEYQCRKIASRLLDIADIAVIGGKLNTTVDKDLKLEPTYELKVLVRTIVGNLLLWQESDPQLCRCIFSIPRAIIVKRVTININEILFVTNFGEAYRGLIKPRKKKTLLEKKNNFHNYLVKEECITLKLTKIPRIHRAVSFVSDPRGEDYCIVQQNPYNPNIFQDEFPDSEMSDHLEILLRDANEEDNIHDVTIKIGNKLFPVHKYIIAHRSQTLRKLCHAEEEVTLKDVNIEIFEQMLNFIYTGKCDLLQVGQCPEKFRKLCKGTEENMNNDRKNEKKWKVIENPVRMLHELSKKYGCTELYNILSCYDMQGFFIHMKDYLLDDAPVVYKITDFPEYYDVVLRCSDGKEIKAHKCILAARMDYFNSMFSVRWNNTQNTTINVSYPSNLVEALLEFIYTDSSNFLFKKDCDFLLKLLVIADEYLVNQLKTQCGRILLTLTYLDLKNSVEILQFAHYYKAVSLKQGVMKYIVSNMAYFLETQALNDVSDEILADLTQNYFEQIEKICCRVITPYSTAVSDEFIIGICNTYPVNMEVPENKEIEKSSSKYSKRRMRPTKNSSIEISVKKCFDGNQENLDSLIQFPDSKDALEILPQRNDDSGVQKRLSAISSAIEALENEDYIPEFVNINESFRGANALGDFPILNSPPEKNKLSAYEKSANKSESRHKIVRMSQRERKRLSSESKEPGQVISESPKNPWKIIAPETTSPVVSPSGEATISNIISNERKLKENLAKITNKLLIHTQLEDKAIVELEKFYNIDNVEDEIITVQRVDIGCIASPIWVPRNQSNHNHS